MDDQSRKVAEEILTAAVEQMDGGLPDTWESLALKHLCLADSLSDLFVDNTARSLRVLQSDEDGAAELREGVAKEMHKRAAWIAMIGGEAAIIARLLQGASQAEAQNDIRARITDLLGPDDLVPGDNGDELLATGLRNYAFASAGVYGLHADRRGVEAYISSLLEVVCGVVVAAALARADESMAV